MNSLLKEYYIKGIIGKGTFSIVKLGIHRITGEKVAIKILNKKKILSNNDVERVKREIDILSNINHVNLIKINKVKEDSENYYMVMEYCHKGELFNYIVKKRKLDENESAYYYFQLINGLEYIHSKKIVHRDLKPENLLIFKKNILKIIDFGLSNFNKNDELLSTPCGSPCYASPEMIGGKKYDGNLIDIWSSGIILYVMLTGNLPFEGQTNEILFQNILRCKVKYPKYLSNIAIDLLQKIIVPYPENRISLSEIKNHPFYFIGREAFKKAHPSILAEIENNLKIRSININYNNNNKKIDHFNCINKTEGIEIVKYNRRKNIHSMNLDNIINNNFFSENESIINTYNTPEKNMNFHFKKISNKSNEEKYGINNKHLFNLKNENNNFDKYMSRHNARTLTEVDEANLNVRKSTDNSNGENITFRKDISKLLRKLNDKKIHHTSKNKNHYQKINHSPRKKNTNFHSIDIGRSNHIFNFYKIKKDTKYYDYNNNQKKNLIDIIKINSRFVNPSEKEGNNHLKNDNLTPEKNFIIKKLKSYNEKKNSKMNSSHNTKMQDKYNYDEKNNNYENKNNYILEKRKSINKYDFNTFNLSKNNYTNYTINNEKNYKMRHISDISYNNPIAQNIIDEIKQKKKRKDRINIKDKKFMKYFKIYTGQDLNKDKKEINNYKFKNNLIINNLNNDINKYNLNDNNTINFNKENDKNYNNYNNRPSLTINNMNYNLNLYEPKIYLSTLNNESMRTNNNLFHPRNKNVKNNKESFMKSSIRKSKKFFNNIINENSKTINNKSNKNIDLLINQNFLTQYSSKTSNSLNKNNYRENILHFSNKKFKKLKSGIINNKSKLLENLNDNNIYKKEENMKNNNEDNNNKDKIINKRNYKKLKSLRKIDFNLLNILKYKKISNRKNKLELEHQRHNVYSPSITLDNTNITMPNNIINTNKTVIKDFLNKNKKKRIKINNDKKINVLDDLLKDFFNFSNFKKNANYSNRIHDFNHDIN